jgi:hypothetical protein
MQILKKHLLRKINILDHIRNQSKQESSTKVDDVLAFDDASSFGLKSDDIDFLETA